MNKDALKIFLDKKVLEFNNRKFVESDPVLVPHKYSQKQDIEIAAFFAANFAWGNRTTIVNKTKELLSLMDNVPHQFILHHTEKDRKHFLHFKHRTFDGHDIIYFIHFLQHHYSKHRSLEDAFMFEKNKNIEESLIHFYTYFFSMEHLPRTEKHISTPAKNSACKRLNMFLRWMIRKDRYGVDFGIWQKIQMSELMIPLDVHVSNVAFRLGLLSDRKSNWKNVESLTALLREMDADDPIKYDFALFALGAEEKFR